MVEFIGSLTEVAFSRSTGRPMISIVIKDNVKTSFTQLDKLIGAEFITVSIKKGAKKRSLDANAYYWRLIGKLSKKLNISNPYCHNLMLRRYGVPEEMDGKLVYLVIPDTEDASKKADEAEEYHIKPTSQVKEGKDGLMYRTYILLKGSRNFSKEEFSTLLQGVIDECKHIGIETRCEEELDSLLSQWG